MLDLDINCFETPWELQRFRDHKKRIAAYLSDHLVAYIVYRDNYIRRLAVDHKFRGNGIARLLVEKSDCNKVVLCETNLNSQTFFRHLGFKWLSTIKHGPTQGRNGYLMELPDDCSSH